MKRLGCPLLAVLFVLTFSVSVWAGDGHRQTKSCDKKDTHSYYQKWKERVHQLRIDHQFRKLKHRWEKAHPDARELFLEYLGSAAPPSDDQSGEYEQQIATLKKTIDTLQQDLDTLSAQKDTECNNRLAQEQEQWQSDCDGRISLAKQDWQADTLRQLNEQETNLRNQLQSECDDRLAAAQQEWEDSVADLCPDSGVPTLASTWDTNDVDIYALDVDRSGNIVALDQRYRTVTMFDNAGTRGKQWNLDSQSYPVDVDTDSEGNIFVLNGQTNSTLQKFDPNGAPLALGSDIGQIFWASGMFIDSQNRIYVADLGGPNDSRILVFDSSGNLTNTYEGPDSLGNPQYQDLVVDEANSKIHILTDDGVLNFDSNWNYAGSWTSENFRTSPAGIAIGTNGDVFVADTYNDRIVQFDKDGNVKSSSLANGLYRPSRLSDNANGRLYVADHGNRQIKIFE